MKRYALILLAVAIVVAVAAPAAESQCGGCGHHRGHHWAQGPRGGPGPMAMRGLQRGAPMYDPGTVTTLSGKVTAVEIAPAGPGRMGGMHLTLEDGGKQTVVHLGPTWFLEQQGFAAATGDTVAVTGSLVTSGDETFLIAREVKKGEKSLTLRNPDGVPAWSRGRARQQP